MFTRIELVMQGILMLVKVFHAWRESRNLPDDVRQCRCGHPETEHVWTMDDYSCLMSGCWCRDFIEVRANGYPVGPLGECCHCGHWQTGHQSHLHQITGEISYTYCKMSNCRCMQFALIPPARVTPHQLSSAPPAVVIPIDRSGRRIRLPKRGHDAHSA